MILPNRAQLLGLAFLTTVATSAAAQSLLNQYGEVVLGSGQAPPSSSGIATDFPLGALMGTTLKHSALLFDGALVGTYATEPTTCYLY